MYGVTDITPILQPPQSWHLGIGAIKQRPIVVDAQVVVASVMNCTLAADHRAIDGAVGAQLLVEFQHLIEEPMSLLLFQ